MQRQKERYAQFIGKHLILRDHLATDRTSLANERTLLAYFRTGLTTIIVGISLLKFFDSFASKFTGLLLIVTGICIFLYGYYRYWRQEAIIKDLKLLASEVGEEEEKQINQIDEP